MRIVSGGSAQLSVTDMRRAARHSVDHPVLAEHRVLGDVHLRIVNVSANGFMTDESTDADPLAARLGRGERVLIRLPEVGRIEAHVIWAKEGRIGFQFERILRPDNFATMIADMQPRGARVRRRA